MSTELARVLKSDKAIRRDPFGVLKSVSGVVNGVLGRAGNEEEAQRLVLYALENADSFGQYRPILEGLLKARGLYPYLDQDALSPMDRIGLEAHRPLGIKGVVLHQKQLEVYARLMAGENIVLSAPTSFGKSLLIDAVIASGKYENIAVVVPTIALIDETRRRLGESFGQSYKLITHASQEQAKRNIFVMTQERVLDFPVMPDLDFFVIDEFYKLDPRRDADRANLLNQALYRLMNTGAQFYMLGPSIQDVADNFCNTLRSIYINTPYATVVSERIVVDSKGDPQKALVQLCSNLAEPTLIYCASPASARRVATALIGAGVGKANSSTLEASEWLGEHYHPDWVVARALSHGIGVHHGKVPRAIAQYAVRAFNQNKIKFLVCTSTLIEGVNTKAKNVVIYDNRVATRKFDFFTFNNICGRSGRMRHHFVGRVYLFNQPPQEDLPVVNVPLITQGEEAPASLLIQLDEPILKEASRARIAEFQNSPYLSLETIRSNVGIDPKAQIEVAKAIAEDKGAQLALAWRGFPKKYEELEFACELIWKYFTTGRKMGGVYSGRHLAYRIDKLSKIKTIKRLILQELAQQSEPDADAAVEDVLEFTRTWAGFYFPRYLMALDRIQKDVLSKSNRRVGEYSAFAASVENLFTSAGLVALDEYGVPLQVAREIERFLKNAETVDGAVQGLRGLTQQNLAGLDHFSQTLVLDAIRSLGPVHNEG